MMGNPYTGTHFFTFFLVLAHRGWDLVTGKLPYTHLVADEIQIGVLAALAISGALVGTFLLLRRMVMLANALSHTLLLGIVLTYLLIHTFAPHRIEGEGIPLAFLLAASLITGILTTFLTETLSKVTKLQEDASIGLVFSLLFALGILLVTLFSRNVHIGTELVMGNADALQRSDLRDVCAILVMNLLCVVLFFPGLTLTTFDAQLARTLGFSPTFFTYLLMIQTSATAIGGFRAVGVLMVLAFFIIPPLVAKRCTHRLVPFIAISVGVGVVGVGMGVALSRHILSTFGIGLSTAGLIVLLLGSAYLLVLFGGALKRYRGYTHMHLKVGNVAQPAPQIWINEAISSQLNLNKLGDAERSTDGDIRQSQTPTFE